MEIKVQNIDTIGWEAAIVMARKIMIGYSTAIKNDAVPANIYENYQSDSFGRYAVNGNTYHLGENDYRILKTSIQYNPGPLDMISGIMKLTAPQYIWDIMKNFQINNTKRFIPIHDNLPEIIVENLGRDFTLNDFAVPDGSVGLIHASITRMNDLRRRYHRELQNGNTEEAYTYLEQIVQCCPASYLISGYISFDYGVLKKMYSYLVTLSYHARFNSYRDMMMVLREIPYSELFITNPGDERDIYGLCDDCDTAFSPMNPFDDTEMEEGE